MVLDPVVTAELEFLLVGEVEADVRLRGAAVAAVGGGEGHGERLPNLLRSEFVGGCVSEFFLVWVGTERN